jgi:hypothetical protein
MADAVSVAGKAVELISIGIQVTQQFLGYYDSLKGCQEQVARTTAVIDGLVTTLQQLAAVVDEDGIPIELRPAVHKSLESCRRDIREVQVELGRVRETLSEGPRASKNTGHEEVVPDGGWMLCPFRESLPLQLRDAVGDVRTKLALVVESVNRSKHASRLDVISQQLVTVDRQLGEVAAYQEGMKVTGRSLESPLIPRR